MSDDLLPLRLCENLRAVPYVPFYLAITAGCWRDAGLAIEHVLSPSTPQTASALLDGSVDVSWGGPMRVMMHHDADPASPLVCFAQVVARDPFVLVGRAPKRRFRFADLIGLRIGVASDVPTPWMTFQDDLQRAGVPPAQLEGAVQRPMTENIAAYERGELDVVQLFEPYADRLVQAGKGHVWHRFSERGDIAYTSFYATCGFIQDNREACRRLVRGIARAQAILHEAAPAKTARAVASFFPDLDEAALTRIVSAYRAAGLWARCPELPPAAFLRLKAALSSGGLIGSDPPYDRVVDPGLSSAIPQ